MSTTSTESLKRKSTDAGLPEKPMRSNKRRAPKACRCCRSRKVRCNVMEFGAPCTNCRLDEVECVIAEGKRKSRKSFSIPLPPQEIASSPSDVGNEERQASLPDLKPLMSWYSQDTHTPHSIYRTVDTVVPSLEQINHSRSTLPGVNPAYSSGVFKVSQALAHLPKYLKPLPSHLGFDENTYLVAKGAYTLPQKSVVEQILQSYAKWHHPLMPILDIESLMRHIATDNLDHGKISILLLQAMLYTGAAHVDVACLRKAGYNDRHAARLAFYKKARMLYDFDCESDRFTQVQALLLLSSWYSSDGKEGWHWLGIAISTACSIGLHRDPSKTKLQLTHQRACKRLFWSLVIRDRLMALGLRRPTCIKLLESDVPPLQVEDYELFSQDISIAITHMELARLSVHMGKVLLAQYSVNPMTLTSAEYTTSTLKVAPTSTEIVDECAGELETWYQQLPSDVQLDTPLSGEAVLLNKLILHLTYHATLSTLHRPQTLSAPRSTEADNQRTSSRTEVHNAACSITDLTKVLLSHGLVTHLPVFGTTVLLPAIVKHLVDLRSPCADSRIQSLQSFANCVLAMQKLQETYIGADVSLALVETAVQRAGIKLQVPEADDVEAHEVLASSITDLMAHARARHLIEEPPVEKTVQTLTPPPDDLYNLDVKAADSTGYLTGLNDPNMVFASTPPPSAGLQAFEDVPLDMQAEPIFDMDLDFDMLENVNAEMDGGLDMPQLDFDHFLENHGHHNPTDANVEHEMGCFLDFDGL